MQKVNSFTIDHRKLKPGIYRTEVNGAYTFDIRFVAPQDAVKNKKFMDPKVAHTLEHFFADYLRNKSCTALSETVLYIGPMGCLTGFYLVTWSPILEDSVALLILDCCNEILSSREIPGATEISCGNFEFFDLEKTKEFIVDVIIPNFNVKDLTTTYPLV